MCFAEEIRLSVEVKLCLLIKKTSKISELCTEFIFCTDPAKHMNWYIGYTEKNEGKNVRSGKRKMHEQIRKDFKQFFSPWFQYLPEVYKGLCGHITIGFLFQLGQVFSFSPKDQKRNIVYSYTTTKVKPCFKKSMW